MELGQLRTFLAVVEQSGFSRAAAALHLTQSTVSFHIKSLEEALGVRLLDRGGGRVRPTQAGRILSRYATRLIALRGEALAKLRAVEEIVSGRLELAASTVPGEHLLPELMATFRLKHPTVDFRVSVSDSAGALARLLAEECELAFVGAHRARPGVTFTDFAEDQVLLVGPSPNRFAPKGALTPGQLRKTPLLLRFAGSGTRGAIGKFLSRNRLHAASELGSSEAVKRAVRCGMGLGFVSRSAIEEELRAGLLSEVAVPGMPIRRRFSVAHLTSATQSSAARAFLQHVRPDRGGDQ